MPDREPEQPFQQSVLTAEQLLTRLLEMIKSSYSVADFGFDNVQQGLGVPLERYGPNQWGTRAQLTPTWNYALHAIEDFPDGARVRLAFFNHNDDTSGDMAEICQLDFDYFTGALLTTGFTKQSFYADHEAPLCDAYTRDDLRVEVTSRGESNESTAKVLHQCIKAVMVR